MNKENPIASILYGTGLSENTMMQTLTTNAESKWMLLLQKVGINLVIDNQNNTVIYEPDE